MADKSIGNSTLEELEELLRDEEFSHMFDAPRNKAPGTPLTSSWSCEVSLLFVAAGSESASSAGTTPGLLNTAFLNVKTSCEMESGTIFYFLI